MLHSPIEANTCVALFWWNWRGGRSHGRWMGKADGCETGDVSDRLGGVWLVYNSCTNPQLLQLLCITNLPWRLDTYQSKIKVVEKAWITLDFVSVASRCTYKAVAGNRVIIVQTCGGLLVHTILHTAFWIPFSPLRFNSRKVQWTAEKPYKVNVFAWQL